MQDSLLPYLHKNKEFKKIHDKLRLPYNPNPAERSHITGKEKATRRMISKIATAASEYVE